MSLTDKSALSATEELSIKIKADKENSMLHITDTGMSGVMWDEGKGGVMRGRRQMCVRV